MRILYIFSLVLITNYVAGQNEWQKVYTPEGGTVYALTESPAGYLFADVGGSGLYRSADNGNNWEIAFPARLSLTYNNRTVVTSDGLLFTASDSVLYRSADNGTTWEEILAVDGSEISGTAIGGGDILYTISGFYSSFLTGELTLHISEDYGETWVHKPIEVVTDYTTAELFINSQGLLFMSTSDTLYRSADQGNTWEHTGAGRVWRWIITPADEIVAGYRYDDGLYVSDDNGDTWTSIYKAPDIVPLNSDSEGYIYAEFSGELIRISPDGVEWAELTQRLPASTVHSVLVSSDHEIFIGTDNLFKSSDGGVTWAKSDHGISDKAYSYVNTSPDGALYIYSDSLYVTLDGLTYRTVKDANNRYNHFSRAWVHPDGDIFMYGSNGYLTDVLFRSPDNGETFEEIYLNGKNLIISSQGSLLLHTYNGLLRSTDKGASWEMTMNNHNGYTVASPAGPIYVYDYPSLYRSDDDGQTMELVNENFSLDWIMAINSQGQLFATDQGESLYLSTDSGVSWQFRSAFPPEINNIMKMVCDTNDNMYIIGSYKGIYRSVDYGLSWQLFNEGLQEYEIMDVNDLHLSADGTLYIAYGGGIWKRSAVTSPAYFAKNKPEEPGNGQSALEVYPNPATDKITITNRNPAEIIRLYDLQGKIIDELQPGSQTTMQVSVAGYKPGFYILEGKESGAKGKLVVKDL